MPVRAPGSDWDIHGCISSAGYSWCDLLGKGMTLGICTEMYCFAQETPYCMVPKPDVSIEPWLMNPPVINPFIGGGH